MSKRVDVDVNKIKELITEGKTNQQIVQQLNVGLDVIKARIKEFNLVGPGGRRRLNVLGKKFGSLTVIEFTKNEDTKHVRYLCKCDCGNFTISSASELINGSKKRCWDCRGDYISKIKWKGFGDISGEFWGKTQKSAEVRNFSFEITIEEAWQLFITQGRKCALTGIDLIFGKKRHERNLTTASLDRIDSSKHYTLDNIQWVHKVINNLKMDLPQEEFIEWCILVSKHKKHNDNSRTLQQELNSFATLVT